MYFNIALNPISEPGELSMKIVKDLLTNFLEKIRIKEKRSLRRIFIQIFERIFLLEIYRVP